MDRQLPKVSVIATVWNERANIRAFLDSLLKQTLAPDELIIVDGASTDGTLEILREYEAAGRIRAISRPCNISQGRNLGVAAARNELIAATDAGCKADPDWLERIAESFAGPAQPDVVAGNYAFETHNDFELASVLATHPPDRETSEHAKYYPSSRSLGFKKSAWTAAKGYPEWLYMGEDTLFNIRLRQLGFKFVFCREAIVRWRPRRTWKALARQHFNYAQGNGRVGVGLAGYWMNLQVHGLLGLLLMLGIFWPVVWLGAAVVMAQHVQRRLLRQAKYAQQTTGRRRMFWVTLAVMETVRLAGLAGFLAGRIDRWRDPAIIKAQIDWMGADSVEDLPRLPAWTSAVMLFAIPALTWIVVSLWGWGAAGPAAVVTALLLAKSVKNFSRTGPQLKEEILRHYAWYSLFSLGRLAVWAFVLCILMAGAGLLLAEGAASLVGREHSPAAQWLAGFAGIAAVSGLQFCRQLLHIPGSIAASSNYRLSRFYPLWKMLSPAGVRLASVGLLALSAAGGILAAFHSAAGGEPAEAALHLTSLTLYALLLLAASWDAEPRPVKESRSSAEPPNILMIGADTLRADRLGIEGYPRTLTPTLDALAARSTYLTHCYIPCGRTAPSLASLLTGTWPHSHGIRDNFVMSSEISLKVPSLPDLLARAGYKTVAISDWAGADLGKFPFGFQHLRLPDDQWNIKYLIRQGPKDMRLFLSLFTHNRFGRRFLPELYYLAAIPMTDELGRETRAAISECAAGRRPFFINAFFSTTHAPFASEYPYYTMFCDLDYAGESKFVMGLMNDPFEIIKRQRHTAQDFDLPQILALYDGCVRRFDDEVGRILRHLEDCGVAHNTIVIIYSDHGIEFFENDSWGQGNSVVVDGSSRIPVMIHDPRDPQPIRIDEVTRNIDIAPTLLDLLGLNPEPGMDGVSLAGRLRGSRQQIDLAAYGETGIWFSRIPGMAQDHLSYPDLPDLLAVPDKGAGTLAIKSEFVAVTCQAKDRMIRRGRWKATFHPMQHGRITKCLFDVESDPDCERDVSRQYPEVLHGLQQELALLIPPGERALFSDSARGAPPPNPTEQARPECGAGMPVTER